MIILSHHTALFDDSDFVLLGVMRIKSLFSLFYLIILSASHLIFITTVTITVSPDCTLPGVFFNGKILILTLILKPNYTESLQRSNKCGTCL